MLRRLFGLDRDTLRPQQYWQDRLAEARRYLQLCNLVAAERLFAEIVRELPEFEAEGGEHELKQTRTEAEVGLWAVRYYQDPSRRSDYRTIIESVGSTPKVWQLIADVLYRQGDASPGALDAYNSAVEANPTDANANRLLSLASGIRPSEESLRLLESIALARPEDKKAKVVLCKQWLRAGNLDRALQVAQETLELDAGDPDAHRCIAYIAETQGDWETAIQHYRDAEEWLRLGVTCLQAGHLTAAANALWKVPQPARDSATWLYHAGLVSYQQGRFKDALHYWQAQNDAARDEHEVPRASINAAIRALLSDQLDGLLDCEGLSVPDDCPYASDYDLRLGVVKLFLERDAPAAEPHLRRAVSERPDDATATVYLAVCLTGDSDDEARDRRVREEFGRRYDDGALFLWLRGLWIGLDSPRQSQRYLESAISAGIDRFLPEDSITATRWIIDKMDGETGSWDPRDAGRLLTEAQLEKEQGPRDRFLETVASSLALELLSSGGASSIVEQVSVDPGAMDPTWAAVLAVYYAQRKEWSRALTTLESGTHVELEKSIRLHALRGWLEKGDWARVGQLVSDGLKRFPRDSVLKALASELEMPIRGYLWQSHRLEALASRLESSLDSGPADTRLHHNMAVVYTRLALDRDEDSATQPIAPGSIDYWLRAIGHWAVALTDEDYWHRWKKRRGEVYEIPSHVFDTQVLSELKIPKLIRQYHADRASRVQGKARNRHLLYASQVPYQIEVTNALRYLVRACKRREHDLPSCISQLLNPLLITGYGKTTAGSRTIEIMDEMVLSPHEVGLAKRALSPLADVHALVADERYETALNTLEAIECESDTQALKSRQIENEILKRYSGQLVGAKRWNRAIEVSRRWLRLRPPLDDAKKALVEASVGWADWQMQRGRFGAAIQELTWVLRVLETLRHIEKPSFSRIGSEDLESIPGIGSVLARRILAHREQHGPVISGEDLRAVAGLNQEVLSRLMDHFRFERREDSNVTAHQAEIDNLLKPNLFQASKEDLESVPGIGSILADRIVEFCDGSGASASPKALLSLSGLGQENVSQILNRFILLELPSVSELRDLATWLPTDLKATLSEALALSRFEQYDSEVSSLDRESLERETQWFKLALALNPGNQKARFGMAGILHDLAVEHMGQENWALAAQRAGEAIEYGEGVEYLNLLVAANRGYAFELASQGRYREAIDMVAPLTDLPYGPTIGDLNEFVSALFTDFGASLYNTGRVAEGLSCWEAALEYDPSNGVARRNMMMAQGAYW